MHPDFSLPLHQKDQRYLWHPFTPMAEWNDPQHLPMIIKRGEGPWLWDDRGKRYFDGNSSIWTNLHGHCHPLIQQCLRDQLQQLHHSSFLGYTNEPAILLAEQLIALTPPHLSRVFYSDDGSTGNETALRLALQYWQHQGKTQKRKIISFSGAYHGDTLGAASLGGIPAFLGSANYFGYEASLIQSIKELHELDPHEHAAIIIEPLIQGAAGMQIWPNGLLQQLRSWCDEHDCLLILDEVMTGFGRTGTMFAFEQEGIEPDFLVLAKGLTGGTLPLAATLCSEAIFESFLPPQNTFYYGHSYCGNPLACTAALANIEIFEREQTLKQLSGKIDHFAEGLTALEKEPYVKEIRRCGFIAGIELQALDASQKTGAIRPPEVSAPSDLPKLNLTQLTQQVCLRARNYQLLTRPIRNTIVLMPPLCSEPAHLDLALDAIRSAARDIFGLPSSQSL